MVPAVDLQVADKNWEKPSLKSESSRAGQTKVCVYVHILGSKGSRGVAQILELGRLIKEKNPFCLTKQFHTFLVKKTCTASLPSC